MSCLAAILEEGKLKIQTSFNLLPYSKKEVDQDRNQEEGPLRQLAVNIDLLPAAKSTPKYMQYITMNTVGRQRRVLVFWVTQGRNIDSVSVLTRIKKYACHDSILI